MLCIKHGPKIYTENTIAVVTYLMMRAGTKHNLVAD